MFTNSLLVTGVFEWVPTIEIILIVSKNMAEKMKVNFVVEIQNSATKWRKIQVFPFQMCAGAAPVCVGSHPNNETRSPNSQKLRQIEAYLIVYTFTY